MPTVRIVKSVLEVRDEVCHNDGVGGPLQALVVAKVEPHHCKRPSFQAYHGDKIATTVMDESRFSGNVAMAVSSSK